MAVSVLTQANCLSPGADLWIIPQLDQSQISPRIDWYLHFQVSKMERHAPTEQSAQLKYILAQTELELSPIKNSNPETLMIPTLGALPCQWVIVNDHTDFKTWVESSIKTWKALKQPSARFFLPTGQKATQFEEFWKSSGQLDDYSVVIE